MGNKTNIQWADSTWNIARGCTKVDGDCLYCYMYRDSLGGTRYKPKEVVRTKTVFDFPLKYKETESACRPGTPLIFTSSLTDVFHPAIDSYRNEVWDIIRKCKHLTFQILSKRPERMIDCLPPDWGDGWDHVWLGSSVGSPGGIQRLYDLAEVPCKTRFVSFEPLWQKIDMNLDISTLIKIHWAIIGGESGNENGKYKYRPCELDWIEEIVGAIQGVGNAVFVKQLGTHLSKKLKLSDRHGTNINEFPEHLRIREFPNRIA